ncbi:MAG: tRNA (N6-threonylcarbamoyladenosine(37)-N6)-methyltransferase TrmO [Desulfobacula sp. GWF2_41_7]|nr:MAG: tRNA (N6-threonylcarbamoyladenosine(37)-N6)-methyltransferase TrmO [Desulfobacula sp. GWF2_41_7]
MNDKFEIKKIGVIRTPYQTKDECPIQGRISPDGKGQVHVFMEYEEGLHTIETFSHLMLFYIFDQTGEILLSRPTFLDDSLHGVFASRHPCRPNSIGISIVKLEKREKNLLKISGVDILDKTPLIDIKPYIPMFDCYNEAHNGWVENIKIRPKPPGRE